MAADSVFVRRLERRRRDAVVKSYIERQIDAKIVVTAEDILQEYYDANWSRGLKFNYSARATKATAVEDLAAEKSILSLPGYALKGQVNEQVADELFALPVGSISPALPLSIKADTVFVAFKVLDEKRVPLIAVRQLIERRLRSHIRAKMERALGISLSDKYAIGTAKDNLSGLRKFDSLSVGPDSDSYLRSLLYRSTAKWYRQRTRATGKTQNHRRGCTPELLSGTDRRNPSRGAKLFCASSQSISRL